MKTMLKALSAVALSATIVHAGDDKKDLKKVIEDQGINYIKTAQKGITLSGYVDVSYTEQFAGSGQYGANGNPGGGPANVHAALRQFDNSNNTFNVNAVKIALEKALPDKNEWAAGFRIDTIYGSDAKGLGDSAFSGIGGIGAANTSGLALEQALVKFRVPVGNGLDIYAGKFVTFLGYEVIESPANLNFSRGLLFTNAIPLTHTGVYVDYKFNDTVEAKFGVVDGWNNSTSGSVGAVPVAGAVPFDSANNKSFGKALTGQITVNAPGKNANLTQSFIYSPEGEPGVVGIDDGPVVVYDIWGNWSPTFVHDNALTLGFNIDFGYSGAAGAPTGAAGVPGSVLGLAGAAPVTQLQSDSNTWWGISLYSQYKFNKTFSLAGRAEYLHTDAALFPKYGPGAAGTGIIEFNPTTGVFGTPAQDDFSYTLTGTFNIWDNLLTRIEYRVDALSGSSTAGPASAVAGINFVNTQSSVQQEISLNAVYSF